MEYVSFVILHYKDYDVVVHANNMVIIGGDCYG